MIITIQKEFIYIPRWLVMRIIRNYKILPSGLIESFVVLENIHFGCLITFQNEILCGPRRLLMTLIHFYKNRTHFSCLIETIVVLEIIHFHI